MQASADTAMTASAEVSHLTTELVYVEKRAHEGEKKAAVLEAEVARLKVRRKRPHRARACSNESARSGHA